MAAIRLQAFLSVLAVSAVLAVVIPGRAFADPGPGETSLVVTAPEATNLGDTVTAQAKLTDLSGEPIEGASVTFSTPVEWNEEIKGEMEIGSAVTDSSGIAVINYDARRSGEVSIAARFEGNDKYAGTEAEAMVMVTGDNQLYVPKVGIQVLGLGPWLIAMVLALVWGLYFLIGTKVLAIARAAAEAAPAALATVKEITRRQFLANIAVPAGMMGAIAGLGSGLITIVARAPYTHGHLEANPVKKGYHRTSLAFVGRTTPMQEMPMPVERDVSFAQEILPIFRAKAGPHVFLPQTSPVPGGVRLDDYERIMEKEDLVVPGKPEESALVGVLLDRSMGMPPAGELLSPDEVQLVVSWIAQGAKNN